MAKRNLAKVAISVTTLDPKLARTMEPRAPTPARRLEAMRRCRGRHSDHGDGGAGDPALNDSEIERILDAAAHAGVKEASYVLLRLPLEVRDLFREWLMANYPDRYRHVFTLIRDMRGGRDYDSQWGTRMGHRADGLDDRPAVRDRLREARAKQAPHEIDHGSFREAERQWAAAQPVLRFD